MQNDKIIIVGFSVNVVSKNIDTQCYLPAIHILGATLVTKTITFSEMDLLPTDNWTDYDLKIAVSSVTNISVDNILFFYELSQLEKESVTATPAVNQYMLKTFI